MTSGGCSYGRSQRRTLWQTLHWLKRLAAAISDADYEAKIGSLLRGRFADDTARDPQAKERWTEAWRVLSQGDHYILVIINEAVGKHVKPWWRFW